MGLTGADGADGGSLVDEDGARWSNNTEWSARMLELSSGYPNVDV